jgi:hypothetical protein
MRVTSAMMLTAAFGVATSLPAFASTPQGPSNAHRAATARASARSLLALAPLPAGSKRLATWIASDGDELAGPMSLPSDRDQVDLTKYFLAPSAARALAWFNHEKVDGHARSSWGTSGGPGSGNESEFAFTFGSTAILQQRMLEYSLLPVAHGALEVRVDALVSWFAQKSRYSYVAGGAIKVVAVVNRGLNAKHDRVSTYSSDSTTTIAQLVTKVNDLPPMIESIMNCPFDVGASVTLRFFRAGATTPYAVVTADPGGCGTVTVNDYDAMDALTGSAHLAGGVALSKFVAATFDIKTLQTL